MIAYQPSNGTEGRYFTARFCDRCVFFQQEFGCPIHNATLELDVTDENYPSQWVEDDNGGNARCDAFRQADATPQTVIPATLPLTAEQNAWLARIAKS